MVYSPPSSKPKTTALPLAKEKSIPDWRMGSPAFHCSLQETSTELLTLPLRWDGCPYGEAFGPSTDPWPHWSHYACRTGV